MNTTTDRERRIDLDYLRTQSSAIQHHFTKLLRLITRAQIVHNLWLCSL